MSVPNISVDGGILNSAYFVRMREPVVFPFALENVNIPVEDIQSQAALYEAVKSDRTLAIFNTVPMQRELDALQLRGSFPQFTDQGAKRCAVGSLVRIVKHMQLPDGGLQLVVRGLKRIVAVSLVDGKDNIQMIRYRTLTEVNDQDNVRLGGRQRVIIQLYSELASITQQQGAEDVINDLRIPAHPARTCDLIATVSKLSYAEKLMILVTADVDRRMEMLEILLNREMEAVRMGMTLHAQVQESVSASQREFFLREQLKAIQQELTGFSANPDVIELAGKIENANLPEKIAEALKKELERLDLLPQSAPEYHISYNYINTLVDIPWQNYSLDQLDCRKAARILDADHFGLEDVKKRILEFLAVMQKRGDGENFRSPILCLVGPPGVGKTSIGKSIARSMKREFIRVSFGGVRDEAEIRGHRRTYIGAMPGRIVQNLRRAGTSNPVFMLDEIDKLAHDFRGDPAAALLEVLDPEQNNAFNDNFVELPLDLSKVFFIATANVLEDIPGPLRDRMEIIKLSGYTSLEKKEIAKRYLIPRQLKENGLAENRISFRAAAINEIIDGYTMEAGVRELDRGIARFCRRMAMKFVSGEWNEEDAVAVDVKLINELLGARKNIKDTAPESLPGCATGMAWTSVGGVILPVETIALPGGKGNLKLTGSLGKVMQESAETAFSFVRANAPSTVDEKFFTEHDFHIHVPDGATPKDGPSAGITITLALMSLLLNKPLKPKLAMTGEITLQGKVTAIGGVREKLVGAIRAGIKEVLVPQENSKDVDELPEDIRKALIIHPVKTFRDAFEIGFGK